MHAMQCNAKYKYVLRTGLRHRRCRRHRRLGSLMKSQVTSVSGCVHVLLNASERSAALAASLLSQHTPTRPRARTHTHTNMTDGGRDAEGSEQELGTQSRSRCGQFEAGVRTRNPEESTNISPRGGTMILHARASTIALAYDKPLGPVLGSLEQRHARCPCRLIFALYLDDLTLMNMLNRSHRQAREINLKQA